MIVRIHSIPQEGLDVSFEIPHGTIQGALPKNDLAANAFDKDVTCELRLDLNKKDVFLTGHARTTIHPICSRCGETFENPMDCELILTCSPGKNPKGADLSQESDEGVIYYKREELDLSQIVREQLLLALPISYLCKPGCLGLCPQCGANLNEGEHTCKKSALQN